MKKVIIDTGCITALLKENTIITNKVAKIGKHNLYITPIIYIEFRNWLSNYKTLTKGQRMFYAKFIDSMPIIQIDEATSQKAYSYSKANINAKLGDSFIAASCVVNKIPLLTKNIKDFKNIKGVKLL
jgi:predicted nucleic acid-binding protein